MVVNQQEWELVEVASEAGAELVCGTSLKAALDRDWERQIIRCPAEQEMPFVPGGVVHFPQEVCAKCPLKAQCTASSKGRSVSIHPDEALLNELRQRQQTPQGRAQLRERVAVEHTLAHVCQWQGRRARYRGIRM